MRPGLVAALACTGFAGCAPPTDPYPVVATAELTALAQDITGPIQILDANTAGPPTTDFELRSVAAFHVRLPDAAPRHVVIYDTGSCEAPPPPWTRVIADLQTIRTVGNETHFFANNVLIKGRRMDIDVETAQAELSLSPDSFAYVLGKIAAVLAADPADGPPASYLACGVFTATPER